MTNIKRREREKVDYIRHNKERQTFSGTYFAWKENAIGGEYIANKHKWIQCAGFLNIEYTILYDLGNDNIILSLYIYICIYIYIYTFIYYKWW